MTLNEYHIQYEKNRLWEKTTWLGIPFWRLPSDAQVIQELIYRIKPDIIIETGTGYGGSALFYASICELIGKGHVITVDIERKFDDSDLILKWPWLHRVDFLQGDSVELYDTIADIHIQKHFETDSIMVILDSWHSKEHVLKEMELYGQLVSKDSYMIVEDTHMNGHPIPWEHGDGPWEAVQEFLKTHDEFVVDKECEKYGMTFNPSGFLKRIS